MFSRFLQALHARDHDGRFSLSLFTADAGIASWLFLAFHKFQGLSLPSWPTQLAVILGAGGLAWLCGLHRDWSQRTLKSTAGALLFFVVITILLHLLLAGGDHWALKDQSNWLAAAMLAGLVLARAITRKLREPGRWALGETLRWVVLGGVATWVLWPLYTIRPSGAGDAYWYTMMLSDYLEQLRAGIFPVWIGQTEYAFNGAVSPLLLAPGFQHAGGILDLLTGQTLTYLAVKNALLAGGALLTVFFAYFSLRAILPQRSNQAGGLALAYLLSPGLLAPLYLGDQYMTFLAAPFLPVALYGCWRGFRHNDLTGHILLGAGIAALWLFHTPVALWVSCFAAALYLVKLWVHRRSGRECLMTGVALIGYGLLGTYPLFSALSLDNVRELPIMGEEVLRVLPTIYPAIFLPLNPQGHAANYQPGYTALVAGLIGVCFALYRRDPAARAFAGASLALPLFILPLPFLSAWIWTHIPSVILKITNVWVFQRLALIWVALLVFTLAAAVAGPSKKITAAWIRPMIFILACLGLAWSAREASLLRRNFQRYIPSDSSWQVLYEKHNLTLTRYPYSSFESPPSYFSHAYMDPLLENRLLDRTNKQILVSNAESAASANNGQGRTLIAEGVFHAVNDNNSVFYLLQPPPTIESGRHHALRMEFLTPGETGYLQIKGDNLFREYMLPDSGAGMGNLNGPPQAFGSTPTSSPVVPIYIPGEGSPIQLTLTNIRPDQPIIPEFDAARYELWAYEPDQLPIAVHTLTPYRAGVDSPAPAYLESPRMWLSGYRAIVNNRRDVPVLRSPNNLCMVEVDAGHSEVEIKYVPPLQVKVSYWVTFWSWAGLLVLALGTLFRHPIPSGLASKDQV